MQILAVIKKHGYRLEDVANMLGITKGSLSATINGSPNVKKLIEIAQKIGCSPAEFFEDWYENEGKEQKREEVRSKMEDVRGKSEELATEQQQEQPAHQPALPADELPFGAGKPAQEQPPLQPVAAFLCPHCGETIIVGLKK